MFELFCSLYDILTEFSFNLKIFCSISWLSSTCSSINFVFFLCIFLVPFVFILGVFVFILQSFHNPYHSTNIITMFKWNNNRCERHVPKLEQMTKPWHNSVDRSQCRCEDIIKMDIKETRHMCPWYKTLPHFTESEDSLLCPQGSLNPAHTDEPYLNKIYFYTIIPILPWFPKQPHRFSFWNESVTCNSPFPLCSLYVPLISYVQR